MEPTWTLMTRPGCHDCDVLKKQIQDNDVGDKIIVMNVAVPEGMAQAAYYETLGRPVPYLIFENDQGAQVIDSMKDLEAMVRFAIKIKGGG